jgi:formate dehydrogenase subunit delta
MQIEKLVHMANQIAKFFAAQGEAATVAGVEDHLRKFWDPRMRTQILAHLDAGGVGLDPPVAAAIARLRPARRP